MKENKKINTQKDKQQNKGNEMGNTSEREAPVSSGGMHRQEGMEAAKEKKPISHRTGDATNFGERSYQED